MDSLLLLMRYTAIIVQTNKSRRFVFINSASNERASYLIFSSISKEFSQIEYELTANISNNLKLKVTYYSVFFFLHNTNQQHHNNFTSFQVELFSFALLLIKKYDFYAKKISILGQEGRVYPDFSQHKGRDYNKKCKI